MTELTTYPSDQHGSVPLYFSHLFLEWYSLCILINNSSKTLNLAFFSRNNWRDQITIMEMPSWLTAIQLSFLWAASYENQLCWVILIASMAFSNFLYVLASIHLKIISEVHLNYFSALGYIILYTQDKDLPEREWHVKAAPGSSTEATLGPLSANTTYYFKIQARNSNGRGPMSDIITYFTTAITKGKIMMIVLMMIFIASASSIAMWSHQRIS